MQQKKGWCQNKKREATVAAVLWIRKYLKFWIWIRNPALRYQIRIRETIN